MPLILRKVGGNGDRIGGFHLLPPFIGIVVVVVVVVDIIILGDAPPFVEPAGDVVDDDDPKDTRAGDILSRVPLLLWLLLLLL